jgi:ferredoxin
MKVWIEQEYCTGDGLCEELCSEVFAMADDGLAYVKQDGAVLDGGGQAAAAAVPAEHEEAVLDAQSQCAGECIHVGD